MIDIDRIITEAINNNINNNAIFATLQTHIDNSHNNLRTWMGQLANTLTNNQNGNVPEITTFIMEMHNFTNALIKAIERCVSRQSLNEAFGGYGGYGFGAYGMNDVPILTNTWNAFSRGFNGPTFTDYMQRIANKFRGQQSNTPNQGNTSGRQQNRNFPPPVGTKLQAILTQSYPLAKQKYDNLNRKYNMAIANTPIRYIIGETDQIIREIQQSQQQQRQQQQQQPQQPTP